MPTSAYSVDIILPLPVNFNTIQIGDWAQYIESGDANRGLTVMDFRYTPIQ
jgi:hypothetical protein